MTNSISIAELREIFTADFEQGILYRNGKVAGTICRVGEGRFYNRVCVHRKQYYAHRILYALYHGEWPDVIDHLNGDTLDNRIKNLASGTVSENMRNRSKFSNENEYGRGIYLMTCRQNADGSIPARWVSRVKVDGENFIDTFPIDKTSLLYVQILTLKKYHDNGFSERHMESLLDAIIRNPEYQILKKRIDEDFDLEDAA